MIVRALDDITNTSVERVEEGSRSSKKNSQGPFELFPRFTWTRVKLAVASPANTNQYQ